MKTELKKIIRPVCLMCSSLAQTLFSLISKSLVNLNVYKNLQELVYADSLRSHQVSSNEGSNEEAHIDVNGMATVLSDLSQTC